MTAARVSVIVPSFNQRQFIEQALESIFAQDIAVEVFVQDGGSTDGTAAVLKRWENRLAGWTSRKDAGQAAAINEGMNRGSAPYVCWLNSDDMFEDGGLATLAEALEASTAPAVYGRTWDIFDDQSTRKATWVQSFSRARLAKRCIVSQPGTLIRRSVWEAVGGLDPHLHMALDYDLWWRIYNQFGPLKFVDSFVASNRIHSMTKTSRFRRRHYDEAIKVVRTHHGRVPLKWFLAQPYRVWIKSGFREL